MNKRTMTLWMKRSWVFLLFRIQFLVVGLGGYLWITHFNLTDTSKFFIPLGFICIVLVLIGLTPLPFDYEVKRIKELEEDEHW